MPTTEVGRVYPIVVNCHAVACQARSLVLSSARSSGQRRGFPVRADLENAMKSISPVLALLLLASLLLLLPVALVALAFMSSLTAAFLAAAQPNSTHGFHCFLLVMLLVLVGLH